MSQTFPGNADLQVTIYTTLAYQTAINVLHYKPNANPSATVSSDDILEAINTRITATWVANQTDNCRLWGYKLEVWPDTDRTYTPTYLKGSGDDYVGTINEGLAPWQCCALAQWQTDGRGRKTRGRCYIPFIPITYLNVLGELTDAAVTAYQGLTFQLAQFQVTTVSGLYTWQLAVAHRASKTTTLVANRYVTGKIATQRRRGDFGRPNRPPY